MAETRLVAAHQNETLDALAWRAAPGRPADLETILDLNPGLAARGARLREGETVRLPITTGASMAPVVQLWT